MCRVHLSRRQLCRVHLSHHLLTAPASGDVRIFLSFSGGISPSESLVASECRPRTPAVSESRPRTGAAAGSRPATRAVSGSRRAALAMPKTRSEAQPASGSHPATRGKCRYQRYVKCEIARIFMRRARKHPAAPAGACRTFIKPASETLFSPYAWLTHFRRSAAYDASCRAHRQGPWPPRGQPSAASCGAIARNAARGTPSSRHVPRTNALSPAQKERGIP